MKKILLFVLFCAFGFLPESGNLYAVNSEIQTVSVEKAERGIFKEKKTARRFFLEKKIRSVAKKRTARTVKTEKPPAHPLAKLSLILGIGSFFLLGFLAGIPALIVGIFALRRIKESGGYYGGRGMAIAGIIIGILWLLFLFFFIALIFSFAL